MKSFYAREIDRHRRRTQDILDFYGSYGDAKQGLFDVPCKTHPSGYLKVIASADDDWEHVSASLPDRCPTWEEMSMLKDLFFNSYECVIQYHPPKMVYVNCHPYTLHLWRPVYKDIPLPPMGLVGPKT